MRYHPHLGELPLEGFKHCGDKKIKPQGGGSPLGFVGDAVDSVGGFLGDAVEDVGGFVGDTVGGVVDTAGAFLENPLEFTENLGKNLLDNPEKIALLVAAYYAPELLSEFAPEVLGELALSAEFAAADATSLAAQGLTESQIASTLTASGIEGFVAADAAALASQGLSQADIARNLAATGLDAYSSAQTSGFPVIGDQAGDYPMSGSYGNPMAEGVKGAVDDLLKYNANYAGGGFGIKEGLKLADQANSLLNPAQPMQLGQPQQMAQGGVGAGGVDYSGLLGLLQQKAKRPDILNLLG
jgi:hypothetical protein